MPNFPGLSFALSSFSPLRGNPVLWLDGNDPAGNGIKPSDGTFISAWVDKSGSGNDYTQASGANQPIYNSSVYNNLGSPVGDGVASYMQRAFTAAINSTDITMLCACKPIDNNTFAAPFSSRVGPTTLGYNIYANNGVSNRWEGWTGTGTASWSSVNDGAPDYTKTAVICMKASGGLAQWYINNSLFGTTTYVPNPSAPSQVFATESAALKFPGYINEVIVYASNVSDLFFTALNNYAIQRWGAS